MMRDELTALMGQIRRLLNAAADLIILNILTLVCCLPVVTIGAAWTACYAHILRLVRRQETGLPLRTYFADFKKALRTATPAWLLTLLCALIVAGDYYFAVYVSSPPNRFFLVFSIVMAAALLFTAVWLYPLMARYENTVRGHIKNAVLLAAGSFPKTLLASAVQLAFFALPLFVPDLFYYFGWLWLMGGLSLPLYLTARIFRKELACVPTPEDEAQAERMEPQENRQD